MRAILLLNADGRVTQWQTEALRLAEKGGLSIYGVLRVASCNKRQVRARNLGYYALASAARFHNPWMKSEPIEQVLNSVVSIRDIACEVEGAWDVLPPEALEFCSGNDVVIKFGLGLLRIPDELPVPHGILSYHHGDPRRYRGRPAGFHEMANGESVMGIMVQRLSNMLDAGEVLSEASSPVYPFSYRRTLTDAYRSGVPLLAVAIRNLSKGYQIESDSLGPNYSLPRNAAVVKMVAKQGVASGSRLVYGAFRHKVWELGRLSSTVDFESGEVVIPQSEINRIPTPPSYTFLADPCGEDSEGVFCEGMLARGTGTIVRLGASQAREVDFGMPGVHFSYPQMVQFGSDSYLFPEVASHMSPCLFEWDPCAAVVTRRQLLGGLDGERILDGTLLKHEDHWYLFGQRSSEPISIARLWHSADLFDGWAEHPCSPIAIDPRRARMAGPIVAQGKSHFRLSQDASGGYGSALTINRIEAISPDIYRESPLGRLTLHGYKGPHTLNPSSHGGYWLDMYKDEWNVFAGLARLRGRFATRR